MTNHLRLSVSSKFCIEWIVQIPSTNQSRIASDSFIFQERKCYLEFYTGTEADLYFKSDERMNPAVEITVLVVSTSRLLPLDKALLNQCSTIIWSHENSQVLGSLLTFKIIRDAIDEDLSKVQEKEDKCVQTCSYLNIDLSAEGLSKDFSKLLDADLNYDTEIKCGKYSTKAHKIVLCARSNVFKATIQRDMHEGRTGVVEIQGVDVGFIQDFIKYLYTDAIPELTFEKAMALYKAGDRYAVRSLVFRCSEYLQDNLSQENVCECLALADLHSDRKLKDRSITYILDKNICLLEKLWLPFCKSCPKIANEVHGMSRKNISESKDL